MRGVVCAFLAARKVLFQSKIHHKKILNRTEETIEHRFFSKGNLPENINAFDQKIISDWINKPKQVIID